MSYQASCHCGAVTVDVDGDLPGEAISCNCSHCRRKGMLLTFVARDKVVVGGEEALGEYRFNKRVIAHRFCRTCGVQPFAEGPGPNGPGAMINLRCVPNLDLDSLKITPFDGASR
ncbi:GFA family protein [Sphingomonas sinipercae]|uniref:GFA family protein n=1 Tax=Sphingomonas sinipercae TaxID=2714944 RepID=A0A6G7ZLV0_9SPHN|nr:GFA family protein [Sphingomonas sinipercae]QIL01876.1 GFA family protein [Sphingomonas sinipercae]